eukprot:15349318-Ditylum_brightwellii.AAC.1
MTTQPAADAVINLVTSTPPKKKRKITFNKFKVKILFTVPRNDKIKPCDKFATLLAVLQQQYTDTALEQRDADDTNQAQSIISGSDLPHKTGKPSSLLPTCSEEHTTGDSVRHRIFMNPMEIKQNKAIVAGFFVFLHVKFHSRKDAAAEIKPCALIDVFDLHVHMCHHMQQRHTKAIAVSCGRSVVQEVKSKLYRMNNHFTGKKDQYPHTKHWIFVPFKADGTITEKHIAMMIRNKMCIFAMKQQYQ